MFITEERDEKPLKLVLKVGTPDPRDNDSYDADTPEPRKHKHKKKKKHKDKKYDQEADHKQVGQVSNIQKVLSHEIEISCTHA